MTGSLTMQPAPLAITMGDPAGIGPELVVKIGAGHTADLPPFLVIGDVGILRRAAQICGSDTRVVAVDGRALYSLRPGVINTQQAGPPRPLDLGDCRLQALCVDRKLFDDPADQSVRTG